MASNETSRPEPEPIRIRTFETYIGIASDLTCFCPPTSDTTTGIRPALRPDSYARASRQLTRERRYHSSFRPFRRRIPPQSRGRSRCGRGQRGSGEKTPLKRASETANAIADATTTSVVVSSRADVEAGRTILIDSEQMYVKSYSSNTLTVVRGVNGTTATSHSAGAAIDIYEYPGPIVEGAIIQTARLWRRKDSAFSGVTGFPDTGQAKASIGLDPDVSLLLGQYRKLAVGT